MRKETEDYLKRDIKRTYKRYTGERTDTEATIYDVAEKFNIPVDKERLEDYSITAIDYKVPSIGIYDKKEGILYFGKYTDSAELLNYGGCGLNFIRVIKIDNDSTLESLYYADKSPLAQKMIIPVDDYEMSFFLENPNFCCNVSTGVSEYILQKIHYL